MEIKYQNLRVLGPAILKVKIPAEIIIKLNEYVDKIAEDKSKLIELNYGEGLVGDVTQEFSLENANEALQALNGGKVKGRAVLVP